MIEWIRRADGSWSFDYSVFDHWVDFMMNEIGITGQIVCYTMIPWDFRLRYYEESKQKYADMMAEPGTTIYDELWGSFLKDFKAHLEGKAWLGKTAIGIDERPDKLMRPALETIRKHAPEFRVVSAINNPSELTSDLYEISSLIRIPMPPELLARRRRDGKITTFYVCCVPSVPNTFTDSRLAEAAWLPLRSSACGFDGFLRWAYNTWGENPLRSTDYAPWPSGDCFLVYPGNRSSLRWERLRDGIEETEKIRLLRALNNEEVNRSLDEVLKPFAERIAPRGIHEDDVTKAAKAVEELSRQIR